MKSSKPVVWMIWDAATAWVVRKLLSEGALPALSWVSKGIQADALPPSPNCQTPPSLATLFTGKWPKEHGIFGYSIPSLTSDLLKCQSGFDPKMLQAEPIWSYVGRQGITSVLTHVPWVMPLDSTETPEGVLFSMEAYSQRVARGGVIVLEEKEVLHVIGPYKVRIKTNLAGEVIIEHVDRGNQIHLSLNGKKGGYLDLKDTDQVYFELAKRYSDGALLVMFSGIWRTRTTLGTEHCEFVKELGPFIGEGLGRSYRNGLFGPRLLEGGSGEAEQMLLNTIKWSANYFNKASISVINRYPNADMYIFYLPCIDDIEHEILGWCDPSSKAYAPLITERAWDIIREVYKLADHFLSSILDKFKWDCTVIVSSDHGMAGTSHTVYINEILRQANLLDFTNDGLIDIESSKVFYHPANNGSLWINPNVVEPHQYNYILSEAYKTLSKAAHPLDGSPLFHAIYPFDLGSNEAGYCKEMGDMFLVAADGIEMSAAPSLMYNEPVITSKKSASHATFPNRQSLKGIFYTRGPGIERGVDLGEFDNRLVFSFLCDLLGIRGAQFL